MWRFKTHHHNRHNYILSNTKNFVTTFSILMACSHHRRGRDKTVLLSCRVGGVNTTGDQTDQTVLSWLRMCSHRQLDKTGFLSCLQLCSHRQRGPIEVGSRRDKTVLSAMWTQSETRQNCLVPWRRSHEQAIKFIHSWWLQAHPHTDLSSGNKSHWFKQLHILHSKQFASFSSYRHLVRSLLHAFTKLLNTINCLTDLHMKTRKISCTVLSG